MTHTATAIKFKHEIFVTQFQSFKRLKHYTYKNVYVMVLSLNFAKMQGLLPIILMHKKALSSKKSQREGGGSGSLWHFPYIVLHIKVYLFLMVHW